MNELLIIRVDASTRIGSGHVMRCLALAHAWRDAGGDVLFATAEISDTLAERLADEGCNIHHITTGRGTATDAVQTIKLMQTHGARWLVADGYVFDARYQQTIKKAGRNLLLIDDYGHADHYYADLILNQNISAEAKIYAAHEPYTQLLLGTDYVLLHPGFRVRPTTHREVPTLARRILVTLGGSDPENYTAKVLKTCEAIDIDGLKVIVVIGGSNPHRKALDLQAEQLKINVTVRHNVNDMPKLMNWADIAIAAGGSTNWELAFMGVPAFIGIIADNQAKNAEMLQAAGVVQNAGWYRDAAVADMRAQLLDLLHDAEMRRAMARKGQQLVDGKGAQRILAAMMSRIRLRHAHPDDARLIWEWANDPAVRAVSFSSDPIPWDTHVTWFKRRLSDPNTLYFVASDTEGRQIGQVRFQREVDAEATISLSVAAAARGQGYGSELIGISSHRALRELSVRRIHAYIQPDNLASLKAFVKAGYWKLVETTLNGQPTIDMVFESDNDE